MTCHTSPSLQQDFAPDMHCGMLLPSEPEPEFLTRLCAGLQQCKSFVEICIVSCLSAVTACACGWGAATWDCPRRRLPCRRDSPAPIYAPTVAGCCGEPLNERADTQAENARQLHDNCRQWTVRTPSMTYEWIDSN